MDFRLKRGRHRGATVRVLTNHTPSHLAQVFMNMNRRLKDTAAKLTAKKGIVVASLHGELEKQVSFLSDTKSFRG